MASPEELQHDHACDPIIRKGIFLKIRDDDIRSDMVALTHTVKNCNSVFERLFQRIRGIIFLHLMDGLIATVLLWVKSCGIVRWKWF